MITFSESDHPHNDNALRELKNMTSTYVCQLGDFSGAAHATTDRHFPVLSEVSFWSNVVDV
jgi:hypothetical protein